MNNHRNALSLSVTASLLLLAGAVTAAETVPLKPADPKTLRAAPHPSTLTVFPSTPVPGHPGADPDAEKKRPPHGKPEYLNYPGSIEHYRTTDQKYIYALNPFNERTRVRNFIAVEMPTVAPTMKETFAEPVEYVVPLFDKRWYVMTGEARPPAPVVRLKPGGPRFAFDLRGLENGLHCVRLIAAIEPKNQRNGYPLDLIVDMKINDGPKGEVNHYVLRQRGAQNFYSMGEFWFHVEDDRTFHMDIGLHPDSKIDLLVHNLDVHYMFAELARRGAKTRSVLVTPEALKANWATPEAEKMRAQYQAAVGKTIAALRKEFPDKTDEELRAIRRERKDQALWDFMPPINSHYYQAMGPLIHSRPDPQTEQELKEKGLLPDDNSVARGWVGRKWNPKAAWRPDVIIPERAYENEWGQVDWQLPWRLVYDAPDGTREYYTLDDLRANKPLPRLPFPVPPWGTRHEVEGEENARFFTPIAQANGQAVHRALSWLQRDSAPVRKYYVQGGIEDCARDAAMLLCRVAYDLPSYTSMHAMNIILQGPMDTVHRCDYLHRHRATRSYQMIEWDELAKTYDYIFPYLKDNQEFATALGRHIPWVKTPQDVIAYLDTYVLQYGARETMYYNHYLGQRQPEFLAAFAALQGDAEISRPWMETLFSHVWIYSQPFAGIQDLVYQTTQRDGTYSIGSYSYTLGGPSSIHVARWIEHYLAQGGEQRFNILDPKRFPRMTEFPYFVIEAAVAGGHALHIGDVGGLTQGYGSGRHETHPLLRDGWRWTKDPQFAWCLANHSARLTETDEEWQGIQEAAKRTPRNPFTAQRSRVLSDWAGILEGNPDAQDFRYRSAARLRVGWGWGHSHRDSLDLNLWAMGMPVSGDHGNRPGYGFPDVVKSMLHNVVTIDHRDFDGNCWVADLSDMAGCRYLRGRATYDATAGTPGTFERQVALIELDPGVLPDAPLNPKRPLPPGARLPRTYVVDFFRVAGGKVHTYNFHAAPEDEFVINLPREDLTADEKELMKGYKIAGEQWAATVQADLTATWRLSREAREFEIAGRGPRKTVAAEQAMLGAAFDPQSPRKYLRVHLPGQPGTRLLTGLWTAASYQADSRQGDMARQAHLVRPAAERIAQSTFAAVWEPFAGESFVESVRIEGDTGRSDGPVALHIRLKDGVQDLCFTDSAPALRTLADGTRVQGRFAYLSRDDQGIRRASLAGGALLQTATLTVKPLREEWKIQVAEADYLEKRLTFKGRLPERVLDGAFFEVGLPDAPGFRRANWTSFQARRVQCDGEKGSLTWRKDAGVYTGAIDAVQRTPGNAVQATLDMAIRPNLKEGQSQQLVVPSPRTNRSWRGNVAGDKIHLFGDDVTEKDFAAGDRIMVYQFGPGSFWRAPTQVSLCRNADAGYAIEANTGFELSLRAQAAAWSRDGQTWTTLTPAAGAVRWTVQDSDLGDGRFLLKLDP